MAIKILHLGGLLSGLYDYSDETHAESFFDAVSSACESEVHYIVVCGDLAYRGYEDFGRYEPLVPLFVRIFEQLLPHEDCGCAPGNVCRCRSNRVVILPGREDINQRTGNRILPEYFNRFLRELEKRSGLLFPEYLPSRSNKTLFRVMKDLTLIAIPFWNYHKIGPRRKALRENLRLISRLPEEAVRRRADIDYCNETPTLLLSANSPLWAERQEWIDANLDGQDFQGRLRIDIHLSGEASAYCMPLEPDFSHFELTAGPRPPKSKGKKGQLGRFNLLSFDQENGDHVWSIKTIRVPLPAGDATLGGLANITTDLDRNQNNILDTLIKAGPRKWRASDYAGKFFGRVRDILGTDAASKAMLSICVPGVYEILPDPESFIDTEVPLIRVKIIRSPEDLDLKATTLKLRESLKGAKGDFRKHIANGRRPLVVVHDYVSSSLGELSRSRGVDEKTAVDEWVRRFSYEVDDFKSELLKDVVEITTPPQGGPVDPVVICIAFPNRYQQSMSDVFGGTPRLSSFFKLTASELNGAIMTASAVLPINERQLRELGVEHLGTTHRLLRATEKRFEALNGSAEITDESMGPVIANAWQARTLMELTEEFRDCLNFEGWSAFYRYMHDVIKEKKYQISVSALCTEANIDRARAKVILDELVEHGVFARSGEDYLVQLRYLFYAPPQSTGFESIHDETGNDWVSEMDELLADLIISDDDLALFLSSYRSARGLRGEIEGGNLNRRVISFRENLIRNRKARQFFEELAERKPDRADEFLEFSRRIDS